VCSDNFSPTHPYPSLIYNLSLIKTNLSTQHLMQIIPPLALAALRRINVKSGHINNSSLIINSGRYGRLGGLVSAEAGSSGSVAKGHAYWH